MEKKLLDQLNQLTKKELIELLRKIIFNNPSAHIFIKNTLDVCKPNINYYRKKIEKELLNHTGSYILAYQIYTEFRETSPSDQDIFTLSLETVELLLDELDTYSSEYPDDLMDYIVEVYDDSCRLVVSTNELSKVKQLSEFLNISIYSDNFIEEMMNTYHAYFEDEEKDEC